MEDELTRLRSAQHQGEDLWTKTVFGNPPVPIRPSVPKQLSGVYYRGNCERNPALFNNGNYLTATFRIQLCDTSGNPAAVGDPVSADGYRVHIELERAPGTTDALFSKEMMASVFFSEKFYGDLLEEVKEEPLRLEVVEPGHRWQVEFPIGRFRDDGSLLGLIYLYTGQIANGRVRGTPHCAVKYDLHATDGKLNADSDLWMSAFTVPNVDPPPTSEHIPFSEWFDHRPIPPITGPNSTDPKLLGVEEYIGKGLIPAEAASGDKPPSANPGETSFAAPLQVTRPWSMKMTQSASRRTSAAL
jgi:hypothetical protein